jgi:hypothetical protein
MSVLKIISSLALLVTCVACSKEPTPKFPNRYAYELAWATCVGRNYFSCHSNESCVRGKIINAGDITKMVGVALDEDRKTVLEHLENRIEGNDGIHIDYDTGLAYRNDQRDPSLDLKEDISNDELQKKLDDLPSSWSCKADLPQLLRPILGRKILDLK